MVRSRDQKGMAGKEWAVIEEGDEQLVLENHARGLTALGDLAEGTVLRRRGALGDDREGVSLDAQRSSACSPM